MAARLVAGAQSGAHRVAEPDAPVNLASRALGASVAAASDEFFGEKENLLRPEPPAHRPRTFGHKGQLVDGWETRRRRGPGHDYALIRLGAPGVISAVVVDTAHFTGNFPAECSVEACAAEGYPAPADLLGHSASWVEIVPRSPLAGDTGNRFTVADGQRFTHVRLTIYPDGGVARLRVEGEVVPDPRPLAGLPLDLVALENGGIVEAASDRFYSAPENMIGPGRAGGMGDGWETRRRRDAGHDWVLFRLAAAGRISQAVVDTSCFLGNAPASAAVRACDATAAGLEEVEWFDVLPPVPLQPDTRHVFRAQPAGTAPATHVRLEIHPDGGLARLRLFGELTAEGRARLGLRWFDRLPTDHALAVLGGECGLVGPLAAELAGRRPYGLPAHLKWLLTSGELPSLGAAADQVRALILG
ncbi:MAG TPA: allantoicase [Streptosporangiaceae bacterium]|nr:allantoicase [Streptosporangiaceae bacterium]